jgi:hypothetical protein
MDLQIIGVQRRITNRPASRTFILAAVLAGIATIRIAGAGEQQPAAATKPVIADEVELDEALVKGTSLWKLRQDMVKTEEQFYKLFNELNTEDDFDVTCRMEAPLGTRLKKRICHMAFYEDAQAEAAQALLAGQMVIDPELVMLQRRTEYTKHTLAVINSDQRLLRLVRQRAEIEKKYDAERKRRFKGWFGN